MAAAVVGTRPRFLVCIDLEATCDDDESVIDRSEMEIIEFPWVIIDTLVGEVVRSGRRFVRPEKTPITATCSQLTGITSATVADAGTLADAVGALDVEIHSLLTASDEARKAGDSSDPAKSLTYDDVVCVTHGVWDLACQLLREAAQKGITLKPYLSRFFDARAEVSRWIGAPLPPGCGRLSALCRAAGAEQHGREHCGLDDAMSVANIVLRVLQTSGKREATTEAFCSSPVDLLALRQAFEESESCVVRITGLPFQITRGEFDAWCAKVDVSPQDGLHVLQDATVGGDTRGDKRPSGEGFAVCRSHEDAAKILQNFASIGSRWLVLFPALETDVTSAQTRPFAEQAASRSGQNQRPGDWICQCGDHQFARNTRCRRCNAPRPGDKGAGGAGTQHRPGRGGGGGGRMKPGDWICQCGDLQFARNLNCRRCKAPRPAEGPGGAGYPPQHHQERGGRDQQMRPGDWICQCGDLQFARNSNCRRCNAPRPGGGPIDVGYPPRPDFQPGSGEYGYPPRPHYQPGSGDHGYPPRPDFQPWSGEYGYPPRPHYQPGSGDHGYPPSSHYQEGASGGAGYPPRPHHQ